MLSVPKITKPIKSLFLKIWPRKTSKNKIDLFLKKFRAHYVSVALNRIGGETDGGYLVPDILHQVKFCFSPGVGETSTFEKELSDSYRIKCFLADGSVQGPTVSDPNFEFDRLFLGPIDDATHVRLDSWISQKVSKDCGDLLLQMDIEGGEYAVLNSVPRKTLSKFICLVIEFHDLHKIRTFSFFKKFQSSFNKIFQDFFVVHAHPNNCCGAVGIETFSVPRVLEVTFLRKDLVKTLLKTEDVQLPHSLDRKNVPNKKELNLSKEWWDKGVK